MADAVVAPSSYSQEGKFDILFPIALPDEGLGENWEVMKSMLMKPQLAEGDDDNHNR